MNDRFCEFIMAIFLESFELTFPQKLSCFNLCHKWKLAFFVSFETKMPVENGSFSQDIKYILLKCHPGIDY